MPIPNSALKALQLRLNAALRVALVERWAMAEFVAWTLSAGGRSGRSRARSRQQEQMATCGERRAGAGGV